MLVENPPKWLFRSKTFFIKSAWFFAYGLQFTYLTMPCCFFHLFAFRFRENGSHNIEESLNGVQWSETKGSHYVNLPASVSMCYMVQVIKACGCGKIWYRMSVQIPNFSRFFLSFGSSFYYIFVNKKNLFVNLNHWTMPVRSAGSMLALTFFLYLTTRHGRIFF